ncbi:hypothetical protein LPJ66_007481 [Kickxella alabastrina]|uniref:Uncharacterized protein n=1 Tax=Kickxella alabastrina TaxID=61397 RepID=A0ACC1I8Q3_9FUNG|nr:hypothetical protein LPJ66_007481 [Kickxella alabastrina]
MQRFITPSARLAPRSLARLSASSSTTLTALTACRRLLMPAQGTMLQQAPALARFLSSESLARQMSSAGAEDQISTGARVQAAQKTDAPAADEYVPVEFASYDNVHENTKKAIDRVMGFKTASKVQDQIISRLPIEGDIMVKAKTGTGKTMAFLIPAIETLLSEYAKDPERAKKGRAVGCLIVSPTRELAKQIATEAERLVKFHGWNVQSLIGGERPREQLERLKYARSDIVIGTPGRILDFMDNQPTFSQLAEKTKLLIFDEADVLLQMGFRKEVDEIVKRAPSDRQTFLVSATLDRKVRDLAPTVFERGFDLIDCVDKGETNTHDHVKQEYVEAEHSQHFPLICDIIQSHIDKNKAEDRGSKIVIFLPTVKCADMYAQLLRSLMRKGSSPQANRSFGGRGKFDNRRGGAGAGAFGSADSEIIDVSVLHGKISQESRTRRSDSFRKFPVTIGNTSILVTTDVSARGVDYPNVSMVLQVGVPSERDAYVHRLGRTGRAGKSGEGVILLAPVEMGFLKCLNNVPITKSEKYTSEYLQQISKFGSEGLQRFSSRWEAAVTNMDQEIVQGAFLSLVAFYQAHAEMIGGPRGKEIVEGSNSILEIFGTEQPPLPAMLRASLGVDRGQRKSSFGNNGSFNRSSGSRGSSSGFSRNNDRGSSYPRNDRSDRSSSFSRNDRGSSSFGGDRGSSYPRNDRSDRSSSFSRNDRGSSSFGGDRSSSFSKGGDRSSSFSRGGDRGSSSFGSERSSSDKPWVKRGGDSGRY